MGGSALVTNTQCVNADSNNNSNTNYQVDNDSDNQAGLELSQQENNYVNNSSEENSNQFAYNINDIQEQSNYLHNSIINNAVVNGTNHNTNLSNNISSNTNNNNSDGETNNVSDNNFNNSDSDNLAPIWIGNSDSDNNAFSDVNDVSLSDHSDNNINNSDNSNVQNENQSDSNILPDNLVSSGIININYMYQNKLVNTFQQVGKIGSYFNPEVIDQYIPQGYAFSSSSDESRPFTANEQTITVNVFPQKAISDGSDVHPNGYINVKPIFQNSLGQVIVRYVLSDGNPISSDISDQGKIGCSFNTSNYINNIPQGYHLIKVLNNVTSYSEQPQQLKIEVAPNNSKIGQITFKYMCNGQSVANTQEYNGQIGTAVSAQNIENNIPKGYCLEQQSLCNFIFERDPQTVLLNLDKMPFIY